MKKDSVLKKYRSRVLKESIIKSLIYGSIFALAVVAFVSLLFFIIGTKQLLISILLGVIALIGGSIYVYQSKFRTTVNAIAKRVDELGLHERVITMIDYADNDSLICEKQREDTQERLAKVESKQIKFRIPKVSFALLGIVAILAGSSLFLPNRGSSVMANSSSSSSTSSSSSIVSSSSSSSSNIDDAIDDIIQAMIEEIRRIINEAEISDGSKAQLHAIVDEMVISLDYAETTAEKIKIIKDTQKDIEKRIELMKSVAKCLQENEVTRDLGFAIANAESSKDATEITELISTSIDLILEEYGKSENKEEYINNLIYSLDFALSTATEEENTELLTALSNFAKRLKGEEVDEGVNQRIRRGAAQELAEGDEEDDSSSIEDARQEIIDALLPKEEPPDPNHPSSSDDPHENMDQTQEEINGAIDDALGEIQDMLPSDDPSKEPEDGTDPGTGDGENDPEDPTAPPFNNTPVESETVIDGETPYLDVFKEYYDEIMDYLASNDVPEDVREVIEKYMEMLKNESEKFGDE